MLLNNRPRQPLPRHRSVPGGETLQGACVTTPGGPISAFPLPPRQKTEESFSKQEGSPVSDLDHRSFCSQGLGSPSCSVGILARVSWGYKDRMPVSCPYHATCSRQVAKGPPAGLSPAPTWAPPGPGTVPRAARTWAAPARRCSCQGC